MENELTLFGNELTGTAFSEKFTTRQLAEQFGTRPNVITENGKKCFPNKKIENGKVTYWTKEEATVLLECLKENNTNQHNLSGGLIGISTGLTPALKIKKAMELMMEGYEEELAILREKNEAQRAKLEEQAPKVEVFDRIADSSGLKSMQEVAKILKIGVNTLFALLRDAGIFYRSNGVNVPHDEHIRRGRFEVKEEPFMRDGKPCAYTRIFVTEKGLVWLAKKIVDNSENKIAKEGI